MRAHPPVPNPAVRPRATPPRRLARAALAAGLALAAASALAEKADRTKPMTVDSNGAQPDVVDLSKHSAVFTGNVVITQGTLVIHADKVEVSEDPDGQRLGTAYGSPDHPATFRQKRDGGDDLYSEGDAQRIEYDSAANRVRFVGAAHLRMLRGDVVTDQASAALITYDTAADTIALNGGGTRAPGGAASSAGRTTVVFTPKPASSRPAPPPLALPASGAAR
ncbi:MAG TPA: lipopolysaccharide transport periplasmic protein LptA [Burkholderiaceae bacterium]